MDAQNMNITAAESATEDVKVLGTPKMTKEEAQQLNDNELLKMVQNAQGHTGKDFSDFMNCDFSYSFLTTLLGKRGYENGWHRTSEGQPAALKPVVIQMKKSEEDICRQSYMIERSVAEEWKQFNAHVPYKTVTLGCALRRFMADVRAGLIKFELEI